MTRLLAMAACWVALAGAQPAAETARPNSREKALDLVRAMELKPGMVVADIGAGWGFMLPFLSRAVGPSGRVLAEDIDENAMSSARQMVRRESLANIEFIKGTAQDPALPEGGVDVALARDSYHHYDHPREMLAGIHKALRPGGRLVVVDYYKRPGAMRGTDAVKHIRADEEEVLQEIEREGFRLVSRAVHLEGSQYLLVFRKE